MKNTVELGLGMTLAMALVVGCAAPTEGDEVPVVTDRGSAPDDVQLYLGCTGGSGSPDDRCKPDLVATWFMTDQSPYSSVDQILFFIDNNSDKPAGAFTMQVKDQIGATLQTVQVPGLGAHRSTSLVVIAPRECGWSRTLVVDSEHVIDEFSETNNLASFSKFCPPPVIGGL